MYCFVLQKVLGQCIDCRFAGKIPPCFEELIIDDLNGISSVTDLESNLCTTQCRSLSGRVRKSTVKIRLSNLSKEAIIAQNCMRGNARLPELPEVETVKRAIDSIASGK